MTVSIYVGRLINPSTGVQNGVRIEIDQERLVSVTPDRVPNREDIQLPSAVCSPALINAHDHLRYTWPEHIGDPPYQNSYDWRPILHGARTKFAAIELKDLYWLGVYKNILSGVSTVGNQSRRLSDKFFLQYPIRILFDFAREIFIHTDPRAHDIGAGAGSEAEVAKKEDIPFVVHIAEGVDQRTSRELDELDAMGGLFENSVLVHGINLSEESVDRIAQSGASLIWCPTSNYFLFNRTAPIETLIAKGVNVALGTDSTCSGSENLLQEMKRAREKLCETIDLDSVNRLTFEFVTINAAKAFKLPDLGKVEVGASADLLIFDTDQDKPLEGLIELESKSIRLLTCRGRWVLGEDVCVKRLPSAFDNFSHITTNGVEKCVVGDPKELVTRVAKQCGRDASFFPLGRILA